MEGSYSALGSADSRRIGIIGLGYVGLPLAVEFGKCTEVLAYDIDSNRIAELRSGYDATLEVSESELADAVHLKLTDQSESLASCDFFIITVPSPIDKYKNPDLTAIFNATRMVAMILKKGDIVVYESTVYPGATEEDCVPILENISGFTFNTDFFCGYSPERINPGDKQHRLPHIVKVTSGSTVEAAQLVDSVYRKIITAGTHLAESIKVAEAAKVIENTQRDLNIALVNELSLVFDIMNIDTKSVLDAASTKWNFLPFSPGLVGGHCIGVDPYYLTHKAESLGYHPEIILAGRRLNDRMGQHLAHKLIKGMVRRKIDVSNANVLIMGMTFKENCPDLRNTKVVDVIDICDPWVPEAEARKIEGFLNLSEIESSSYDAVVVAVAHDAFVALGAERIRRWLRPNGVLFDVKSGLDPDYSDLRL